MEVSGHVNINDEEESDNKRQPTDCISKPASKDVMNTIAGTKTTVCFQTLEQM